MNRLKPLMLFAAAAVVVTALVRNRLEESRPVDPGGWEPVDPSR